MNFCFTLCSKNSGFYLATTGELFGAIIAFLVVVYAQTKGKPALRFVRWGEERSLTVCEPESQNLTVMFTSLYS